MGLNSRSKGLNGSKKCVKLGLCVWGVLMGGVMGLILGCSGLNESERFESFEGREEIEEALGSEDWRIREKGVKLLVWLLREEGNEWEVMEILKGLRSDENENVRVSAVRQLLLLSFRGYEEGVKEELEGYGFDVSSVVRLEAVEGIRRVYGKEGGREVLLRIEAEEGDGYVKEWIRRIFEEWDKEEEDKEEEDMLDTGASES